MKKLLFTLSVALCVTAFSQEGGNGFFSNINFGVRASGLLNTTSLGDFKDVKSLEEHGFNVGVATKINVYNKFFVTPEAYFANTGGISEINVPVLLGYSILGDKLDIIAGPSMVYTLEKDDFRAMPNFNKNAPDMHYFYQGVESAFDFGYVAGLQYHLGKFMVTGRYQGTFNGREVLYYYHRAQKFI